jgi:hypothetical protein
MSNSCRLKYPSLNEQFRTLHDSTGTPSFTRYVSASKSSRTFRRLQVHHRSRNSIAGVATGYKLNDRLVGVQVPVGVRIFTSPRCPDRVWRPPNLTANGYRGLFPHLLCSQWRMISTAESTLSILTIQQQSAKENIRF